jgi:DNA-binding NarL/FixJ family response regulator
VKRNLTPREAAVIKLIALGYTDRQIANALGIQHCTVRTHLDRIANKTGKRRRVQMAVSYIENPADSL